MADLRFNVSAETRAATAALGGFAQSMQRELVAAVRSLPNIELTADSNDAQRELKAVRDALAELANKRVGVDIDAGAAIAEAEQLQARLNDLQGSTTDVQIRADAGAASGALDRVLAQARDVDSVDPEVTVTADTSGVEQEVGGLGDGLKATAAAAGLAIGATLAAGVMSAMEAETVEATLAAKLGGTGPVSEAAGRVAGQLYAGAYGESFGEVGDAVAAVAQGISGMATASEADLQRVTGKAMSLSTTFGQDLTSTVRAVDQMLRTGLAPNADVALDILTRGFQTGTNEADDLLDTFAEYSTQFRKFGLDAETATGILQQGLQAGARDADIVADAIKEFSIRAVDGSELTAQGFADLGLSAEEMVNKIARGGPEAAGALDLTIDRLRAIEDPLARSQIAAALFGTQAEDLGDALFALDPSQATQRLGDFTDAAGELDAAVGATAQAKVTGMQRAFEGWTASLVATDGPIGDVAAAVAAFGPAAMGALSTLGPLLIALRMNGIAAAIKAGPGDAIDDVDRRAGRAATGGVGRLGTALKFAGAAVAIAGVGMAVDQMNIDAAGGVENLEGQAADMHEAMRILQGDFTELGRAPQDITDEFGQMSDAIRTGEAPISAAGVNMGIGMAAIAAAMRDGKVEQGELAAEIARGQQIIRGETQQSATFLTGQFGGAFEQVIGQSQAMVQQFSALTGTVTIDANADPATGKVTQTVTMANGQTGTMTLAANGNPASLTLAGTKYRVDTTTGVMTINGNPAPGQANLSGFRAQVDRTTGVMSITARDAGAYQTAVNTARAISAIRAIIQIVARPFGHDGMVIPAGFHDGGVAPGYAAGGVSGAVPFRAGTAQVFGPNRLRFTGDRNDVDEFYIPDNAAPQSLALGAEWAQRRGMTLVGNGGASISRVSAAMGAAFGRGGGAGAGGGLSIGALVAELRGLRRDVVTGNTGSAQLQALRAIVGALQTNASPATARAQAGLAAARDGAW